MDERLDHPFYEVVANVERLAARGDLCFQKFTCAGCGNRLTMGVPNRIYTTGSCDRCGHVTDIEAQGCNFLLLMSGR